MQPLWKHHNHTSIQIKAEKREEISKDAVQSKAWRVRRGDLTVIGGLCCGLAPSFFLKLNLSDRILNVVGEKPWLFRESPSREATLTSIFSDTGEKYIWSCEKAWAALSMQIKRGDRSDSEKFKWRLGYKTIQHVLRLSQSSVQFIILIWKD